MAAGIGLFALPTDVLASGFAEVLARKKEKRKTEKMRCPHCGRYIEELAKHDDEEPEER